MTDHGKEDDSERRDYFRIEDDVHLTYRMVSDDEYRARLENTSQFSSACSTVAQLRAISRQGHTLLSSIRKRDPELAQFLALTDKKVELIARMLEGERHEAERPNTRVNIGAGGFSFFSAEPLEEEAKLEVQILFFPDYLCIHGYGRVVRNEQKSDDPARPYGVGVEFTLMPEAEREALVRHTLEKQSAMLRERRGR